MNLRNGLVLGFPPGFKDLIFPQVLCSAFLLITPLKAVPETMLIDVRQRERVKDVRNEAASSVFTGMFSANVKDIRYAGVGDAGCYHFVLGKSPQKGWMLHKGFSVQGNIKDDICVNKDFH